MDYQDTWVSISNQALARLGSKQITSLEDNDNTSKFCNTLLPLAVKNVFGTYNWNCAKSRVILSHIDPLSEEYSAPPFEYLYYFELPVGFYKIVWISSENYKQEGNKILANDETIDLIYMKLPTEPTEINPPALRSAVIANLAYLLSKPLLGAENSASNLYQESMVYIQNAKIQDSNDIEIEEETFGVADIEGWGR